MHDEFEQKLAAAWPPSRWQDVTVLLAVSGGPDSVALLRAMASLATDESGRLAVGHVHHGLRPHDDDADQELVQQICRELGLACHVGRADVARAAELAGDGLEAAARTARYRFLQITAEQLGARYLVTAHTADDQAETILFRILRGTGITGLAGMRRARPLGPAVTLIRPLLEFPRHQLLDYLARIGQPFREDQSNLDTRHTRNRIRHELLPLLARQYNRDVSAALLRLGRLATEASEVIDGLASQLFDDCVHIQSDKAVTIQCRSLAGQPEYLIREVFLAVWREQGWPQQAMGYEQWRQLAGMVMAEQGDPPARQRVFPGAVTATRHEDHLRLARYQEAS